MFVSNEVFSPIDEYLAQLDARTSSMTPISTDEIKEAIAVHQQHTMALDKLTAQYEKGNVWSDDTFLSAKTAIMWESHVGVHQADKSIRRGELLNSYPVIAEAARAGLITTDHITSLLRISDDEKYHDHFINDVDQIIGNASVLTATQFSLVVTMWKHSINELLGEATIEYEAFKERYLNLYQDEDGYWIIEAKLDPMNGSLLQKSLTDVNDQLWHATDKQERSIYGVSKRNADSIGYIAQGYLSHTAPAIKPNLDNADDIGEASEEFSFSATPALTADVVIDINDLDAEYTTQAFLRKAMTPESPLVHAHSRPYLEQILCDTSIQVPVKHSDGTFNLGRKTRTAPWRLKKQLMLSQKTCSASGCTIPAHWCDAHHIHHWAHGGQTNLDNLMLLCRRHHTIMHNDVSFAERIKHKSQKHKELPPILNSAARSEKRALILEHAPPNTG